MPFVKKIISGLRVTFEGQQQTQFFTEPLRTALFAKNPAVLTMCLPLTCERASTVDLIET